MSHIAVVSINTAKPGREAELEAAARAMLEPTRKEAGCIEYNLHVDPADPRTYVFLEKWQSRALLDQHLGTPHLLEWRALGAELIETKTLRILDLLD
jgi:quinol monooxygenase YgiN